MRIVLGPVFDGNTGTGEGRKGRHHEAAGSLILKKILNVLKNDLDDALAFEHREGLA